MGNSINIMSNNIAIKVENLSKVYKLYDKPTDRLKESLHWKGKKYHKDFYALNDVSFEIKKGETVGIIGKNGSGKSTLLKIITGVLSPTSGKVTVNGKVSALLELGAGFNPEYTGIENIYFQGNLMGYTKEQMDSRLQDILDFADIGDFIYQPVKMYSSGMFARLAFAVAINVEPDILIVDEALSVGDMRFQNKCMRQMEELCLKGITILFVSHDIQAISKFCNFVIWINNGCIIKQGQTGKLLESYLSFMSYGLDSGINELTESESSNIFKDNSPSKFNDLEGLLSVDKCDSFGLKNAKIHKVGFLNNSNKVVTTIRQGEWIAFVCVFSTDINLHDVGVGILFKDRLNNEIFTINSYMYQKSLKEVKANKNIMATIKFKFPKVYPKEYSVTVALSEGTQINHIQQHWVHEAIVVNVKSLDMIDGAIIALYPEDVEYVYEQI